MNNPYELPNCAVECAFICKLSTQGFCPRPALEKQLAAMRELSRMADEEYRRECETCHGAGRIAVGEYGSHYRDGEKYDPPGYEQCDDCGGFGWVEDGGKDE